MILKTSPETSSAAGVEVPEPAADPGRLSAISEKILVSKSVEFILRQTRVGTISALLMAAGLGVLIVPGSGWGAYLAWYGVLATSFLVRQWYFSRLIKRDGATPASLRTIAIISAVSGWIASTSVPLFGAAMSYQDFAVSTTLMVSWVAVAVSVLSVQPKIYTIYMVVCLCTIFLGWVPRSTGNDLLVIGLGIALGGMVLHRLSQQIWSMIHDTVMLGAQNKLLADQTGDALASARNAYASRSRFLAAASHDLLQPVHSIKLLTSVLQRTVDVERRNAVVEQIVQSTGSLDSMFRSILDLAQIDAGTMHSKPQALAMSALLAKATAGFQDRCAHKGLGYTIQNDPDCAVWIDPVMMGRIISNLLENALKFTPSGGIRLATALQGNHVEVVIEDTGVGISAADMPFVFEAFFRGAAAKRTDADGVGLGLAITKHMADLMSVQLTIGARPSGPGTLARLLIPLAETPVLAGPGAAVAADLQGRIIALIEDDNKVRKATELWLREHGAECLSAESGEQLITALSRAKTMPDMILADYGLGHGENGLNIIKRIHDRFGLIPAVIVSGDKLDPGALGGIPLVAKPVQFDELRNVMARLLKPRANSS